jgi:hypothetical protein
VNAGYAGFALVTIDTHQLGEHSAFTTARSHALDADGNVARDTRMTYPCSPPQTDGGSSPHTNHL